MLYWSLLLSSILSNLFGRRGGTTRATQGPNKSKIPLLVNNYFCGTKTKIVLNALLLIIKKILKIVSR